MASANLKTDFLDGTPLPASDLNNNFAAIKAALDANGIELESIIEEAEARLLRELQAITAERGWDWNGEDTGERVTFFKGNTAQVNAQPIVDGRLSYNRETGETYLDDNNKRIPTGAGNVIAVGEEEPTNPSTKLWIPNNLGKTNSEVVNSLEGNETHKAPSVNVVKKNLDDLKGYVLYESSDGTAIGETLNDDINNYVYVEIFANLGMYTKTMPLLDQIWLSAHIKMDTDYYATMKIEFNSNAFSITSNKFWYLNTTDENSNKVYKIIGYK